MAVKKQEKVKVVTPQDLVQMHEQNVRKSLDALGLIQGLAVQFPKRKKTPLLGKFGAWLVNKVGGEIRIVYRFNGNINSDSSGKKSPKKE